MASKRAGNVRVLGFDPGFASTGWCVLDWRPSEQRLCHVAHGCLKTSPDNPTEARVLKFSRELKPIFDQHRPAPGSPDVFEVCAESYQNYGRVHWNGVQTLYMLGALIDHAAQLGYTTHLIGAREAKLKLGVKTGEKGDVAKVYARACGLDKPLRPVHASDAGGIALAGLLDLRRDLTTISVHGHSVWTGLDEALARVGLTVG